MSQYIKLLQHNGGFISVLADDNGIIQYTTNDADYSNVVADPVGGAVQAITGVGIDNTDPENPVSKSPNGWTRVDVASSVQDKDITFAGETGYVFEFIAFIINAANAIVTYSAQPNAVSTNQNTRELDAETGAVASSAIATLHMGYAGALGWHQSEGKLVTKTGTRRPWFCDSSYETSGGSITGVSHNVGRWTDSTTPITKVTIHADTALGIGAGSFFLHRAIPLGA